ncbi:MAG TPA: hypothetical protein VGK06_04075 [Methanosarcina sp.]|jgi:copper(I)-binding protein
MVILSVENEINTGDTFDVTFTAENAKIDEKKFRVTFDIAFTLKQELSPLTGQIP